MCSLSHSTFKSYNCARFSSLAQEAMLLVQILVCNAQTRTIRELLRQRAFPCCVEKEETSERKQSSIETQH